MVFVVETGPRACLRTVIALRGSAAPSDDVGERSRRRRSLSLRYYAFASWSLAAVTVSEESSPDLTPVCALKHSSLVSPPQRSRTEAQCGKMGGHFVLLPDVTWSVPVRSPLARVHTFDRRNIACEVTTLKTQDHEVAKARGSLFLTDGMASTFQTWPYGKFECASRPQPSGGYRADPLVTRVSLSCHGLSPPSDTCEV